jgi:hypothetical protein
MIHWILLLQEFELQIVQRKVEQSLPPDQAIAAAVHIPSGTTEEKEENGCCEGISDILIKIMCMPRRKLPRRLQGIVPSLYNLPGNHV